ncbi:MAG TPA: aminodeoxychorismate lyase, partial [Desulfosporosinus sp.]
MSRKRKKVEILIGIILVLLVAGLGCISWWSWATKPYSTTGNIETITITSGTTAAQLAEKLQQQHLIRSAWAFRYIA